MDEVEKAKIEKSNDITPDLKKLYENKSEFYRLLNNKMTPGYKVSEFDVEYKNEPVNKNIRVNGPHHYEKSLQKSQTLILNKYANT